MEATVSNSRGNSIELYLLKNSLVKALVKDLAGGELSPKNIGTLIKKLEEYGGMVIAVGTTIISAYTGLKGMFGN